MKNRLSDLEEQLGQSPSRAPLEMRLRSLQQQLNPPDTEADTAAPTPTSETSAPTVASPQAQDPLFRLATYRVTLPADLLFAIDQATLQPNARPLLDTILPDLSRYQGATILIGSHTDDTLSAEESRQLTFQQAMAIRSYFTERLGQDYHWVAVGYGHSQPLVAAADELGQQRNRRVEIAILLP
ncbi:OmpA family protein [Halomicronema hongdechloris]|nr:OmpA family protein [Halomicronema hongdechloris]